MFCKKCGNPLNADDKFCIKCGTPVDINPTIAPTQPVPQNPDPFNQPAPSVNNIPVEVTPAPPVAQTNNVTPMMQPPIQPDISIPKKKSFKLLFIAIAAAAVVLIIGLSVFLVYYFSGPVVFERNSELLSGSGYSLRMIKGWDTSLEGTMISVNQTSSGSIGLINKGEVSYSDAKSSVDEQMDALTEIGAKLDTKKETNLSEGKEYVIKGSMEKNNKTITISSYMIHNDKDNVTSWLLLLGKDKNVIETVSPDSKYILASVKVDDSSSRSMLTSSDQNSVESIFNESGI